MPPADSYAYNRNPAADATGRRFALYCRKSTEEDERQSQSIESQRTRNVELAERTGRTITHVFEESRSAKEPGRVEFTRMLALIDAGEIDGIIAWHPDRLARNELDGAALTYRLRKGTLKDLGFVEYFFHNSPEGIMMLQMALSQSQYQVSKLSLDVRRGLEDKIKKGWHPHRAPLGYRNNKYMDKGQKTISPDPERFDTLRQAWRLLLTGVYTPAKVLDILNHEWGFRTPETRSGHGGKPLTNSTYYRLLGNVFYAGYFVHNGTVHKGQHPPMVTLDEFETVQELLLREAKAKQGIALPPLRPRKTDSPFVGLIRCEHCGSQVTVTNAVKPSGKRYTYYHCAKGKGDCGKRGIRSETLEAMIDDALSEMDLLPEFYEWGKETIEREDADVVAEQEERQEKRRRALEENGKMRESLMEMRMRSLITDEEYRTKRDTLAWEGQRLTAEMKEAEDESTLSRQSCLNALEYMKNAREWLRRGDPTIKRIVAKNLGSNYVMLEGKVVLEPHPLLHRVAEAYPALVVKYQAIELGKTGSERTKKRAMEALRRTWSGIWECNQTDCILNDLDFPDVANQIELLRDKKTAPDHH